MATFEGEATGAARRVAVVVSRFNPEVTEQLLSGAMEALGESGVGPERVDVLRVPGAWELVGAAAAAAATERYHAVVALGAVIRGETPHFDYVAGGAAEGLLRVALDSGLPVSFGVLTTDTLEQAMARAGGQGGNKGRDAALVALEMADLYERIERGEPTA